MGWESRAEFESLLYPEFMAGYLNPGGSYYQQVTWANCRPGTEFIYSTPGFDLLGYLVEQVSDGRFSPKALREAIEAADGTPGMYFWAGILEERDTAAVLSGTERQGAFESDEADGPRALAWLRDNIRSVLLSKRNIEAERVLFLLRAMINPESVKSRNR